MENDKYDFIGDIDTVKDSWKLKVRILSLWKTTFQLDMIVMDEKCDKIHATVKKVLMPVFENVLGEGVVVMLSKFGVGANNGKYPVLKHKYKLNFYRSTSVKRVLDFNGPMYGFQFFPFSEVFDHLGDPDLPVDVIGSVVECGDMEVYDKGSGREGKRITLDLEDLDSVKLKCTLWDDFAQQFHNYVAGNKIEHQVVIIVRFGRLRNWRGVPSIQNALFSTKLFIDAEIPEVTDFRKRFIARTGTASSSQGGSHLSSQRVFSVREEFLKRRKRMPIDEIVNATEPVVCVVLATITSVEEEHGWFYIACRKCKKKVVKKSELVDLEDIDDGVEQLDEDGKLYCPKCNDMTSAVFPSFKVQVRVQDGSGTTSFVMFDRDVTKLLHKHAFELREKQIHSGDSDTFPDDFESLLDKTILFKVDVSKYNIDIGYQVYTVLKVSSDPNLMSDFVNTHPDDQDNDQGNDQVDYGKPSDSSNGCFENKDVVSFTGDSSTVLEGENETAASPLKRPIESVEKDNVVENSSSKKKFVAVKIEKP